MNLKKIVAEFAEVDESQILVSPKVEMGDFCLPCFEMAKAQKCNPKIVAEQLKEKLFNKPNHYIDKLEVMGGYLNFFVNRSFFAKNFLAKNKHFVFSHNQFGKGQTVCVEFCSANLAKYLHIGHLSNIFIGESLSKIYKALGYNVIKINYLGDYGTTFGKMVVAIKKWGNLEEIKRGGIAKIQELYVKFSKEENEELMNLARASSKNIEDKTGEDYEIYQMIISSAVDEVKRILNTLNITFDDWRGESYYSSKIPAQIEELKQKGVCKLSEGAQIVDLEDENLGVAVVQRSDDGSVYLTRDLCAVQDRFERYNFDELLYVVASEQKLHFKQLKAICKRLGRTYVDRMEHISYGLISTPNGKISSRNGPQATFVELYDFALNKATEVIKDKTFKFENKTEVAKKVAKGVLAFSALKAERGKDKIFDTEKAFSFDGETAPYLQYAYARMCSLVRKFEDLPQKEDCVCDDEFDVIFEQNFELFKNLATFEDVVLEAQLTREPCIISRALLAIAKAFNQLYVDTKIVDETHYSRTKTLIGLVKLTQETLAFGMNLLGIDTIEEM